MSENVYEKCPVCHNHRVGRDACRACAGDGFVATGLTAAQVEAAALDARRMQYIKALRMSVLAPADSVPGWVCMVPFGVVGVKRYGNTESPQAAIDAALKGLGVL